MGVEAETIISAQCISKVCCQLADGCEYVDDLDDEDDEDYDGYPLCAFYRNSSSRLCSECIDGYSESVNSEQCVKCEKSFYWQFLFLPLAMAVAMSAIILITNFTEISRTVSPRSKDDVDDKADDVLNEALDVAYPSDLDLHPNSLKDEQHSTLREFAKETAKKRAQETKLMLASLAKIVIYYEQVKWTEV